MWNKFESYFNDNVRSVISTNFYGVRKIKKLCQQCFNGFYSYINFFCAAFDLRERENNNEQFNLENEINKVRMVEKSKETAHFMCEICLTEQDIKEYDDYYKMNQHLTICLYRGENYIINTKINFKEFMTVYEMESRDAKQMHLNRQVNYKLIGAVNRIIKNGKEEFYYYCRDINNEGDWITKDGIYQTNSALNMIQKNGQVIMLFYNKM